MAAGNQTYELRSILDFMSFLFFSTHHVNKKTSWDKHTDEGILTLLYADFFFVSSEIVG